MNITIKFKIIKNYILPIIEYVQNPKIPSKVI